MSNIVKVTNVSKAVIVMPIKPSGAHQFNPGVTASFEELELRPNWKEILDQMLCIVDGEQVPSFTYCTISDAEEFVEPEPAPVVEPTPEPTPEPEPEVAPEPEMPEITDSVEVVVDGGEAEPEPEVEPEAPAEVAEEADPVADVTAYSRGELLDMSMKDLRVVGNNFGVRDNKRTDLVTKILKAQEAK